MTNEKTVLHYCGRPINELPREELEEAFAQLFSDYTDLNEEVNRRRKEAFAGWVNEIRILENP